MLSDPWSRAQPCQLLLREQPCIYLHASAAATPFGRMAERGAPRRIHYHSLRVNLIRHTPSRLHRPDTNEATKRELQEGHDGSPRDYSQRNATRGLYGSISSAARRKGMTSGARAPGTSSPASAIPSGSLRNASVCASASCLRLVALIATELDGPASIAVCVIVMLLLMMMGAGQSAAAAIYMPLERIMETDEGMG